AGRSRRLVSQDGPGMLGIAARSHHSKDDVFLIAEPRLPMVLIGPAPMSNADLGRVLALAAKGLDEGRPLAGAGGGGSVVRGPADHAHQVRDFRAAAIEPRPDRGR